MKKKNGIRSNIYYITRRFDEITKKGIGWVVKSEKAKKIAGFFKTKEEAIEKAQRMAKNKSATVIIESLKKTNWNLE
ncbi:DUF2188 domain-containing protein [[Mycoplasma] testudinis]|uniref:DUF2188 domain-containing protein n=1 Tax=[Mycoplasma] testudinis TaxID=33924 RepID=UPI000486065D|nr:DUF2188 domain-containing protein [[Mycoplasma] testudinis]